MTTCGRALLSAVTVGVLAGNATAAWVVNKDTVAKYVNKEAPAGPTGVKVAIIKPGKLLKVVAKSLGDVPLDLLGTGTPTDSVRTAFTVVNGSEVHTHCSTFPSCTFKEIAAGTGGKLVCKGGLADPVCTGQGVDATKLIVVDKLAAAGKAKLVFVAKDQVNTITKGAGTDPGQIGVAFDLGYNGPAEPGGGSFIVPAGADSGGTTTSTAPVTTTSTTLPPGIPDTSHYRSYPLAWPPLFGDPAVELDDALLPPYTVDVGFAISFWAPTDKNSEGVPDPVTHQLCYEIFGRAPWFFSSSIEVDNQFGSHTLMVGPPFALCVPTERNPGPVPAPLLSDHQTCYFAGGDDVAEFVSLADPFQSESWAVTRPIALCVPTDKNGEGILKPEDYVVCYQTGVGDPVAGVDVRNQFLPAGATLDLLGPDVLCVPSTKVSACGNWWIEGDEECELESPFPIDVSCPGAGEFCFNRCRCMTEVAIPPAGGTVMGMTVGANNASQGTCGGFTAPDAAFAWVPATTGPVIISTDGSDFDTVAYVLEPTGVEVGCNDDSEYRSTLASDVVLDATAGEPMIIVVDGYGTVAGGGGSGNIQLSVGASLAGCTVSAAPPQFGFAEMPAGFFIDCGDETVHDTRRGEATGNAQLQWEKKEGQDGIPDPGNLHDVDNLYSWAGCCNGDCGWPFESPGPPTGLCQPNPAASVTCFAEAENHTLGCAQCDFGTCDVDPDGRGALTTIWDWINQVNAERFAGHNDWRLPSQAGIGNPDSAVFELHAIFDCNFAPCIHPIFGATNDELYWSATSFGNTGEFAETVAFSAGGIIVEKTRSGAVRAVR